MINSGHVEYHESTKLIIKYNRESSVATRVKNRNKQVFYKS